MISRLSEKSCYRLPAEWHQQDGVLLSWPHSSSDWGDILDEVEPAFCQIAGAICASQQLLLICHDQPHKAHIENRLRHYAVNTDAILWLVAPCNDTWCRDYGPITVIQNGQLLALDFQFNGWGNKYDSDLDNRINSLLKDAGYLKPSLETVDMVLEGGSIETDGMGTLLTTTHCLLAPSRNPDLSQQQIEELLGKTLGISRTLWLEHGYLSGDDTDSHIDNLARFCDEDTLVFCSCSDPYDEHYESLNAMRSELEQFTTPAGKPYRLVGLDIPSPIYDAGKRLPASYINFLILNDKVLLPVYNDRQDSIARDKLADIFPGREIVTIDCCSVIRQYGSIHCLTMQLPAGSLNF